MKIMGILNVTPDSFSDGVDSASRSAHGDFVTRGLALLAEGADILDVGGESTRPGATMITESVERSRVTPVLRELRGRSPHAILSIDTRHASVAAAAIEAGANFVNDVSAGADPDMFDVVARAGVPIVLMHMRGNPDTMQSLARYRDVCTEVWEELESRDRVAAEAGITDRWLDPGIGFAKDTEQNLEILRDLPKRRRHRILLGASRKAFIGRITGQSVAAERIEGSLAVALAAYDAGVGILRVHDVAATRRALAVWSGIRP